MPNYSDFLNNIIDYNTKTVLNQQGSYLLPGYLGEDLYQQMTSAGDNPNPSIVGAHEHVMAVTRAGYLRRLSVTDLYTQADKFTQADNAFITNVLAADFKKVVGS